jgi:hypothetical protein
MCRLLGIIALLATMSGVRADLKAERLDALADETPLSVHADAMGRLFVGCREALFVYEPKQPRKLLYRFPPHSRINDIETRGNDLYVLTRSALYVIPDGVREREDLKPKKLLWGVPRGDDRQGFRALAWGPQGDLYLALGADGDGYWTFFNGDNKTPYRGAGAILRCNPDGSNLQVVARGLRYSDGLVFDRYWNLFSCDSDKKHHGRLLHVTPHAYFDGSLQPMLDGERTTALTYHDGALIGARPEKLLRLKIEPQGAGFHAIEQKPTPTKAIAVTVGLGGRLFAITAAGDLVTLTGKVAPFETFDLTKATPEKLWQELSEPSWPRRCCAHVELMRRGGELLDQANKRLLATKATDPALHHLIWLAAKSEKGSLHLLGLVDHPDPLVRAQLLRALAEYPDQLLGEPVFAKALADKDPRVVHAAMSAFFSPKVRWTNEVQIAIERGPARSSDGYLRQTAALLLAEQATRKQLEDLCSRADPAYRLAGVTAVGYRLTLPSVTKPLPTHLPLTKWRDEPAYVIEFADGKVDLREHGRLGTFTAGQHWKADMQTADQNLLFKLLRKMANDEDQAVRGRAAEVLMKLQ